MAALLKPGNRKKLGAILTYHVVGTRTPAAVPTSLTLVQTLNASQAKVLALRSSGNVAVNGVRVLEANIHVNDSIIREARDVLCPASCAEARIAAGKGARGDPVRSHPSARCSRAAEGAPDSAQRQHIFGGGGHKKIVEDCIQSVSLLAAAGQ